MGRRQIGFRGRLQQFTIEMVGNENQTRQRHIGADQCRPGKVQQQLDRDQRPLDPRQHHFGMMTKAILQAKLAAQVGEVPVGAVIATNSGLVSVAHNHSIGSRDPTAHAEVAAIRAAAAALGGYRLDGASLYVTLEPCVMCVGAIVNARIARVYYGARDGKAGALGSVYDIGRDGRLNHRIEVYGGIVESECAALLREFFRARRA
jgi:tRNA(adenine34) deaminase